MCSLTFDETLNMYKTLDEKMKDKIVIKREKIEVFMAKEDGLWDLDEQDIKNKRHTLSTDPIGGKISKYIECSSN